MKSGRISEKKNKTLEDQLSGKIQIYYSFFKHLENKTKSLPENL